MLLLNFLITLLIIVLIVWAVRRVVGLLGVPQPMAGIIDVILVVVCVLWLVSLLGYGPIVPRPLLR